MGRRTMLVLDFETRSRCDLKAAGAYNYASDPSTEILCCAFYDSDTDYKEIWYPAKGDLSERVRYSIKNASFIVAHNAEFDKNIYEYVAIPDHGWPKIEPERWYCSAAQCRVNAIPNALDDAAMALGLTARKDHRGSALIRQLSIPQKDGTFNDDPALHAEFREYCMQDVIVCVAILKHTRLMTVNEHADWLKTVEINERGVMVDMELARLALKYAKAEQDEIGAALSQITKGKIDRHTQNQRIKAWLQDKLGEMHPLVQEMVIYKGGKAKLSLDKNIRRNLLEKIDDASILVDDDIREVVLLLDEGNMSSVSKFKRMTTLADPEDHRVRGAFMFAGASQTMRYASRGLQVHNMKRDCWDADETEGIKFNMRQGGQIADGDETVMSTLAKSLRPAIIPKPGHVLVVGDWSSIEARCLHWGTDTLEGDQKLVLFEEGVDVYQETADELQLEDRQQGKVVELSAGYQGHANAFQAMARNYGVKVSHDKAGEIVNKWRLKNWWVVDFWAQMEKAAKDAIQNPGKRFSAGMVEYLFVPDMMNGTLLCVMPGNHCLTYPEARIELVRTPWGAETYSVTALKAAYKPKADAKK